MPELPLPITATRFPLYSTSCCQFAVCITVPSKSSIPGTSGNFHLFTNPDVKFPHSSIGTCAGNHNVRFIFKHLRLPIFGAFNRDRPFPPIIIPLGANALTMKLDKPVCSVFLRDSLPILKDFVTVRVETRPIPLRFEREIICVGG